MTELADMTRDQLYEEAQALDIDGRSQMDKDELYQAVLEARGGATREEQENAAAAQGQAGVIGDPNVVTSYNDQGQPLNSQGQVVTNITGYERADLDPNTGNPNNASLEQGE